MRHKFLVLTVKELLESVYIYGSYRKIKTGLSLFWTTRYILGRLNFREGWEVSLSPPVPLPDCSLFCVKKMK